MPASFGLLNFISLVLENTSNVLSFTQEVEASMLNDFISKTRHSQCNSNSDLVKVEIDPHEYMSC